MSTMNYVTHRYPESLDECNRASINNPAYTAVITVSQQRSSLFNNNLYSNDILQQRGWLIWLYPMSDYVLHDVKFISGILIARNKYRNKYSSLKEIARDMSKRKKSTFMVLNVKKMLLPDMHILINIRTLIYDTLFFYVLISSFIVRYDLSPSRNQ